MAELTAEYNDQSLVTYSIKNDNSHMRTFCNLVTLNVCKLTVN
jgi:hypothetical protein